MSGYDQLKVSAVGKARSKCKYPNCTNLYYSKIYIDNFTPKRFHRFPSNPDVQSKWREVCHISAGVNCKSFFICQDHFTLKDYTNPKIRNRLNSSVIPKPISDHTVIFNENPPHTLHTVRQIQLPAPSPVSHLSTVEILNEQSRKPSSEPVKADHSDKFAFLLENKGILRSAGVSTKSELTERETLMYRFHRNVTSRLSKLRTILKNKNNELKTLHNLYQQGRFQFIQENLQNVTKDFLNSQLRNANSPISGRRWTLDDKTLALVMYKQSPRLYRFLRHYFLLPSIRGLKYLLSSVPFKCGLLQPVLDYLKMKIQQMNELDHCFTLIFDEISLSKGFFFDTQNHNITGYEDLGPFGRNNNSANHALVFMIRGVKMNYKMPVAYYFVKDTIKTVHLKQLIVDAINHLQQIGLVVVATVCDQGPTNRAAVNLLHSEYPGEKPSPYSFYINGQEICTIFDVPHLLKNTRNALINSDIEYEKNKYAKFEYIASAFNLDQTKTTYKILHKLKLAHFNFQDSYIKMKVKVAAQQLSHTVAAALETFHISGDLPSDSLNTAQFVHFMDTLFDSLNGSKLSPDGKPFRAAISENSPHIKFLKDAFDKIRHWQIIDSESKQHKTSYRFVEGWLITIRAVIRLWYNLSPKGLKFLSTRNLNQDPLENLFCQIRQHGVFNTNPTCHQFVAALKTIVLSNFSSPLSRSSNCEDDYCKAIGDFSKFLKNYSPEEGENLNNVPNCDDCDDDIDDLELNYASSYVAGYILKSINVPDCLPCRNFLCSEDATEKHLFVSFKEYDYKNNRLTYASDYVIQIVDRIHNGLYQFLNKYGYISNLEQAFKEKYMGDINNIKFCNLHNCLDAVVDKCIRVTIYKYLRDQKGSKRMSDGHVRKVKRFKEM